MNVFVGSAFENIEKEVNKKGINKKLKKKKQNLYRCKNTNGTLFCFLMKSLTPDVVLVWEAMFLIGIGLWPMLLFIWSVY